MTGRSTLAFAGVVVAIALLAGCAGPPKPPARNESRIIVEPGRGMPAVGSTIASLAIGMVGTRYRFGGADPKHGFDCSGLVFYSYTQAGYSVPRTAQEQFRQARKIALRDANAGDLIFFRDQAQLSHVGIYLGEGQFVHAPASGQNVAIAKLDTPYYRQHLVAIGRLLPR